MAKFDIRKAVWGDSSIVVYWSFHCKQFFFFHYDVIMNVGGAGDKQLCFVIFLNRLKNETTTVNDT